MGRARHDCTIGFQHFSISGWIWEKGLWLRLAIPLDSFMEIKYEITNL